MYLRVYMLKCRFSINKNKLKCIKIYMFRNNFYYMYIYDCILNVLLLSVVLFFNYKENIWFYRIRNKGNIYLFIMFFFNIVLKVLVCFIYKLFLIKVKLYFGFCLVFFGYERMEYIGCG